MAHEYGEETLSIEFKSDLKRLPDEDLLEAVVALANSEGGTVYLGVENDGTPTGLCKAHQDPIGLAAMIANRTVPPVSARTTIIGEPDKPVMRIDVAKAQTVVSTKTGKILRRRLKVDGTPESIPMYPYEISTRLSDLGFLDFSAQPVTDATRRDFDPTGYDLLRKIINKYNSSDKNLLELGNEELEKALQLTTQVGDQSVPTLTGLLLLGKEESIRRYIPTHSVSFQILKGTKIIANQDFHEPLLQIIETVCGRLEDNNPGTEIMVGIHSMLIPDFDPRGFREALVNAVGHRDYTVLGRIIIQLTDEGLTITNPGGFVQGINIHNLLTAVPRGRNPCLMDALKRTGLAERTGRGIDRIYEGALQYGRPAPDYTASTSSNVSVYMQRSAPDESFVKLVVMEKDQTNGPLSINSLMVLNLLKNERRCNFDSMLQSLDMRENELRTVLGRLIEDGLVEGSGAGVRRAYILSGKVYAKAGKSIEYVRQTGIDHLRYQELIMKLVDEQGSITRLDVDKLLHLEPAQSYYQLVKLVRAGLLSSTGKGRGSRYMRNASALHASD